MDGYKAYQYYMAIKLHFTKDKFNVFLNKGKVKCTRETFQQRNDKYLFEKLAMKHKDDREYIQFVACNFAYGDDSVIYEPEQAEANFFEWNRRKQSMTKIFSDDLNKILLSYNKNFTENFGKGIIDLYLGKKICLETVRIIDDLEPFIDHLKDDSSMMLMFESEIRRLEKSKGFVKYKSEKVIPVYDEFKEELKEIQNGTHI